MGFKGDFLGLDQRFVRPAQLFTQFSAFALRARTRFQMALK